MRGAETALLGWASPAGLQTALPRGPQPSDNTLAPGTGGPRRRPRRWDRAHDKIKAASSACEDGQTVLRGFPSRSSRPSVLHGCRLSEDSTGGP